MTARNYCFTAWKKPEFYSEFYRYFCYGEEVCPTTGKVHFQGYLELFTPVRISALKKIFGDDTVHFEKRKGSKEQAIAYCEKDGKFSEFGKRPKTGRFNSITEPVLRCVKRDVCDVCKSPSQARLWGNKFFLCNWCVIKKNAEMYDYIMSAV